MNKKHLFLILLATVLVTPCITLAVPTIGDMAVAIKNQVLIVGAAIIIIFWVVTGILFLTAQGEPGKLNSAKMSLFAAIAGTILIILANYAWSFVAGSFGLSGL